MNTELPGVGTVRSLFAPCVGKKSIVQIYFYSLQENYNDYRPIFKSILDSFVFDSGYEYSVAHVKEKSLNHLFNRVLGEAFGKAIIGAIIGGLLGLVILLIGKIRKKKDVIMCPACKTEQDGKNIECSNCGCNLFEDKT